MKESKILAPIVIFTEDDNDEIKITDTLLLRKITPAELVSFFGVEVTFKEQLVNSIKNKESVKFWDDIPQGDLKIIGIDNLIYPYYILEANTNEEIKDFIFAVRLMSEKTVICPKGIIENTTYLFRPFNFCQEIVCSPKNMIYTIPTDFKYLIETYKLIHNNTQRQKKEILNARLNLCIDYEQNDFIRFIESVSIIESILCGNDTGELSFRFSLFSSYILKKNQISISSNEMKKFYNIRSKLVHTGKDKDYTVEKLKKILFYTKTIYSEYLKNSIDGEIVLSEIENTFIKEQ